MLHTDTLTHSKCGLLCPASPAPINCTAHRTGNFTLGRTSVHVAFKTCKFYSQLLCKSVTFSLKKKSKYLETLNWIWMQLNRKTPSDEHTTNESDDYRRQIGDVRRLNETRHFGGRETKKHIKRNIKADELQHQIKPALTWPPARAALDTRANSFDLPNKKSIFARRNKTNNFFPPLSSADPITFHWIDAEIGREFCIMRTIKPMNGRDQLASIDWQTNAFGR